MKEYNKKNKIIVCVVSVLVIACILGCYGWHIHKNNEVTGDYIAVFHGGAGEITYETYIYKIDNGHANMGFRYVNQTCITTYWGSPDWNCNTTKTGTVTWTDDVFEAAYDNYAYGYVTVPGSDKTYTIDEFQRMFLMD